jgi:hypothetical protein
MLAFLAASSTVRSKLKSTPMVDGWIRAERRDSARRTSIAAVKVLATFLAMGWPDRLTRWRSIPFGRALGFFKYPGVPADEVGESRAAPKKVLQVLSSRRNSSGQFSSGSGCEATGKYRGGRTVKCATSWAISNISDIDSTISNGVQSSA